METIRSSKKLTTVISTFLLASFIIIAWMGYLNSNLKDKLNSERLSQDSILSAKILLDKEILGLSMEINQQKGKNARLDSLLNATGKELETKIKLISRLSSENSTVKSLRKELGQIKKMKENLNKQLDEITADNKKLNTENHGLRQKVQSLEEKLSEANGNNQRNIYAAQNFRIEMQKKNPNKLTVKIRKTRNIQLYLDLAGDPQSGMQTIYIKIVDPKGYVVAPYITPVVINGDEIVYTKSCTLNMEGSLKRAIISVKPGQRMKTKGVYKIMVYNEKEGLIGSSEVNMN